MVELLGCDYDFLVKPNYSRDNYSIWDELKKSGNGFRTIEAPNKKLKKYQKKLNKFLSRIESPDFLMSGKRGRSSIKNGFFHLKSSNYVLCVDITDFYPSIDKGKVFRSLKNDFLMSDDIAEILTKFITIPYKNNRGGCLPTGAPSSQIISYMVNKDAFYEINEISKKKGIKMSLYVDDLTFSSKNKIPKSFKNKVGNILKKEKLFIKNKKTKLITKGKTKIITGVAIDKNNNAKIPNRKRKEIFDIIDSKKIKNLTGEELDSLLGKLHYARQIEPNFLQRIYKEAYKLKYKEPYNHKYREYALEKKKSQGQMRDTQIKKMA